MRMFSSGRRVQVGGFGRVHVHFKHQVRGPDADVLLSAFPQLHPPHGLTQHRERHVIL